MSLFCVKKTFHILQLRYINLSKISDLPFGRYGSRLPANRCLKIIDLIRMKTQNISTNIVKRLYNMMTEREKLKT